MRIEGSRGAARGEPPGRGVSKKLARLSQTVGNVALPVISNRATERLVKKTTDPDVTRLAKRYLFTKRG